MATAVFVLDDLVGPTRIAVTSIAVAVSVRVLSRRPSRRVRVRTRTPHRDRKSAPAWLGRGLSFLGVTLALASSPATAAGRSLDSTDRGGAVVEPPWLRTGGFPPPRPLVRPGAPAGNRTAHPALHRDGVGTAEAPLFPRSAPATDRVRPDPARFDRATTTRRSSAGENYVVRRGDALWTIAARVLDTDNPRRIARYWPKIHRLNREVIGPDPNLIFPGQVLHLPDEDGM